MLPHLIFVHVCVAWIQLWPLYLQRYSPKVQYSGTVQGYSTGVQYLGARERGCSSGDVVIIIIVIITILVKIIIVIIIVLGYANGVQQWGTAHGYRTRIQDRNTGQWDRNLQGYSAGVLGRGDRIGNGAM